MTRSDVSDVTIRGKKQTDKKFLLKNNVTIERDSTVKHNNKYSSALKVQFVIFIKYNIYVFFFLFYF